MQHLCNALPVFLPLFYFFLSSTHTFDRYLNSIFSLHGIMHINTHTHTHLPSLPAIPGVVSLCCQQLPSWLCSGWPLPAPAVGRVTDFRADDHSGHIRFKAPLRSWIMATHYLWSFKYLILMVTLMGITCKTNKIIDRPAPVWMWQSAWRRTRTGQMVGPGIAAPLCAWCQGSAAPVVWRRR